MSMSARLPRKRFYRARAHSNPLSDSHFPVPISPAHFSLDYSAHYPRFHSDAKVRFADVGCGFGGLLVSLSPLFPDTLMIGMELRDKAFLLYLSFIHLFYFIYHTYHSNLPFHSYNTIITGH
jgi:tRNA (guanine-N7-)-methyltransferase